MAFVNDYVGEVVLRVEGGQEGGVAIFVVDAEGLIGGDMDACILGVVRAVRLAKTSAASEPKTFWKALTA